MKNRLCGLEVDLDQKGITVLLTYSLSSFLTSINTEIAKLWDADSKSPSMILFKDGQPVTRLYETSFYLDVVAKMGKYCRAEGEEHKEIKN